MAKDRSTRKPAGAKLKDEASSRAAATPPGSGVPVLLRYYQAQARLALSPDPDLEARKRVISHLIQKSISLNSGIAVLDAQLPTTTNPPAHAAIALELVGARAESDLCQARIQAINSTQPFQDPGVAAEAALAAAISTVDQAAANTAAVANLIAAVDGLVQSYAAAST